MNLTERDIKTTARRGNLSTQLMVFGNFYIFVKSDYIFMTDVAIPVDFCYNYIDLIFSMQRNYRLKIKK